jgi:pyruvate,water dikinase
VDHIQPAEAAGPPLVLPLQDVRLDMLERVGGKAGNLGELIAGGFPVPDGFCLTTAAYHSAVPAGLLEPALRGLAETDPADLAGTSELAAAARSLVLDAGLPPPVEAALRHAYLALSGIGADADAGIDAGGGLPSGAEAGGTDGAGVAVAVRSSATAEDLPFASFAGQQDTFLNVIGLEALFLAVRKCWASRPMTLRNVSWCPAKLAKGGCRGGRGAVHGQSDQRQAERGCDRCQPRPRGGRGVRRGQSGPFRG